MSADALKLVIPKLPELDKEDVKAVRSFLPGKLLGRTAALLSLMLLVLGFVIAVKLGLRQFLNIDLAPWAYGLLIGSAFLAVVTQVLLEWRAERNRRVLQALAVNPGVEQMGYFRIGPYQDSAEDRTKFSRPDKAERKVLEWIKKSACVPLYLTGDSGSGKSSLLNAFVLPKLRELGWNVVEARAWQDPQGALREALTRLPGMRRPKANENRNLREIIEEAAKRAPGRQIIVLDQFEEFVILAKTERHQEFAAFVADLQSRPVNDLVLLLVLRSDYQMLLEDIGLPLLRAGDNLFQIARFQISAANAFMKQSGLDLQPHALDRLLTSAAELDDSPGLVRPITLNVIGYVLASGKAVAASLDAGALVRHYIEQTVDQPAFRGRAPRMLEQMITEQGTKRPCSEHDLGATAKLRPAEIRAILNGLGEAGLVRRLDPAQGVWELSHDFIARAVARVLSQSRRPWVRPVLAYAAPALLAITLLGGAGVAAWNRVSMDRLRAQLADVGIVTARNSTGFTASARSSAITDESLPKLVPLIAKLGALTVLDLRETHISSLEPLKGFTGLKELDLSGTKSANLEPLKGLTALQKLDLKGTKVESVEPLRGLTDLQKLDLWDSPVADLEPLKELTGLQFLGISGTKVESLEPLKGLTALQELWLRGTKVKSLEPLKGLTALQELWLRGTKVESLEPLKGLTALQKLDLTGTKVESLEPLKGLTALKELDLSGTTSANLEPLKGLVALRWLNISGTKVADLEPLKGLTALQVLNLSKTQVTNLEPLKELTALQKLDLTGTQVPSLEPVYDLPNLRLVVDETSISKDVLERFHNYRGARNLPH